MVDKPAGKIKTLVVECRFVIEVVAATYPDERKAKAHEQQK
jgi:hypothetical protein